MGHVYFHTQDLIALRAVENDNLIDGSPVQITPILSGLAKKITHIE